MTYKVNIYIADKHRIFYMYNLFHWRTLKQQGSSEAGHKTELLAFVSEVLNYTLSE